MTDPIHEQLSAFLDGELSEVESELLLKRIERDPELKVLLERYVLAGEAVRATQVQARPSRDFSKRVATAIKNESAPGRARWQAAQWLKPVAGGAIAAGVAAVALVSFQMTPLIASREAPGETGTTLVANNSDAASSSDAAQISKQMNDASRPSLSGDSFTVPSSDHRVGPPIHVVSNGRLANYVVAHSEYSSPLVRRNVLTGLVAEEVSAGQPAELLVVEQLPLEETLAPTLQPNSTPQSNKDVATSHSRLSRAPR